MRWRELIDSWIFHHVLGVRVRSYVGRTLLAEMKQICSSQTQCYLRLRTSYEDLWLSIVQAILGDRLHVTSQNRLET